MDVVVGMNMTSDHEKSLEQRLARIRTVRGDDGRPWTVREMQPAAYDRRGRPSLVFENQEAMRLVRRYPENWYELPEDELYAVSLGI